MLNIEIVVPCAARIRCCERCSEVKLVTRWKEHHWLEASEHLFARTILPPSNPVLLPNITSSLEGPLDRRSVKFRLWHLEPVTVASSAHVAVLAGVVVPSRSPECKIYVTC
jgi:hypothetical protein